MMSNTKREPTEPLPSRLPYARVVLAAAAVLLYGASAVQADDRDDEGDGNRGGRSTQLRSFIDQQVGGIGKLKIPATNADLPVPPAPASQPDRYQTTEAKRFLGKMLFHDPVRTARINLNSMQPVDLPAERLSAAP